MSQHGSAVHDGTWLENRDEVWGVATHLQAVVRNLDLNVGRSKRFRLILKELKFLALRCTGVSLEFFSGSHVVVPVNTVKSRECRNTVLRENFQNWSELER